MKQDEARKRMMQPCLCRVLLEQPVILFGGSKTFNKTQHLQVSLVFTMLELSKSLKQKLVRVMKSAL